jgi:DNA-binding transcriptional MerR regulator
MATETELWRIGELRNRAADALATGYEASDNGQVSAVPDARSIRYYGTLGLVDKPAEMRGRTAYYGRRHLLQLVSIKRLQARGLKLAEVQSELRGLSNGALEALAAVPEYSGPARPAQAPSAPSARRESFWNAPVLATLAPASAAASQAEPTTTPLAATLRVQSQLRIELAPGVHVVVDTDKQPGQAERKLLGDAAQGLLDALRACGLHQPQNRREP